MPGNPIRAAGRVTGTILAESGAVWHLAAATFDRLFFGPFRGERIRFRATVLQALRSGYSSVPLVALISLLLGMIVALQSAYQLQKLGAVNLVANLVAITVTRELAPLITAIIVAGRFGSAIAAELGTMKVSQEIDALTVMGISPISYLVVPRVTALMVSLPCLTIFADVVGILGGLVVSAGALGIGADRYLDGSFDALRMQDIATGLAKAGVFAGIIGLIGCQQGLQTQGGADGVGRSTTASVVRSIVLVIVADLFVTALFYLRD